MSPQHFKKFRESFGLTQSELALCFGLTQKTISQYEMGFRVPGPTVKVVVKVLEIMPVAQSAKLLQLMKEVAEMPKKKSAQRKKV